MSAVYGVVTAEVISADDPEMWGRVKVRYKNLPSDNEAYWAPVATMMTGDGRGTWYRPEVGDDVLVAFDQGDMNHPYVIGYLWNGRQRPPSSDNQLRLIHSVNGHKISLYDPDVAAGDTGYVKIEDAHGNSITLQNAMISIQSVAVVQINAPSVIINGRIVAPIPNPI
ncbi:MAG: hypothetical protein H6661_02670 [Ardenticatenaceae bacterium]|nr:hypothetical protein [Ardenticatenaceae bacterium]